MKKLHYRNGQEFCYNCGSRFLPDRPLSECRYGDDVTVTCPHPECNRGSWAEVADTSDCPMWWEAGFVGSDTYNFGHKYNNGMSDCILRDCYNLSDYNQGLIEAEIELDGWSNGRFTRSDKVW